MFVRPNNLKFYTCVYQCVYIFPYDTPACLLVPQVPLADDGQLVQHGAVREAALHLLLVSRVISVVGVIAFYACACVHSFLGSVIIIGLVGPPIFHPVIYIHKISPLHQFIQRVCVTLLPCSRASPRCNLKHTSSILHTIHRQTGRQADRHKP